MIHVSDALIVLILWINLTGLALALRKYAESWALARVASPVALAAVFFFVEHFFGLGRLGWIFPLSTAASLYLIARAKSFLYSRWRTEALFYGGFLYALAWRYSFPDIDASSEKITDLTFVANYFGGGTLPPVDRWLPPFAFEMRVSPTRAARPASSASRRTWTTASKAKTCSSSKTSSTPASPSATCCKPSPAELPTRSRSAPS